MKWCLSARDQSTKLVKESDFDNESPCCTSPWLVENVGPVCHSFLSRWIVGLCRPMGGQWWGCNSDPGKNSPLFPGRWRSVTSLPPAGGLASQNGEGRSSPLTGKRPMWESRSGMWHFLKSDKRASNFVLILLWLHFEANCAFASIPTTYLGMIYSSTLSCYCFRSFHSRD